MDKTILPKQFALDISHTPQATLDNFLPGQNTALFATLQALVASWDKLSTSGAGEGFRSENPKNPLNHHWIYWWGPEGSGRSHLLRALGNAATSLGLRHIPLKPNEPISWVGLEDKITALGNDNRTTIITVDDVDRLDERLIGALFRILNQVQASKAMQIFMTGKAAPANLELREDLRTRLAWGLVFQTHLLSDDEKIQALEQTAKARGLNLSPDVLPWLLNRFYRDMPNLMALIDALDAYSLETKRAVTLPLVRELLQPK